MAHYRSFAFAVSLTQSIVAFNAWVRRREAPRPAPLTYPITPPSTPQPWHEDDYFASFVPYDMDYEEEDDRSRYSS
jgi:hypothetical protein